MRKKKRREDEEVASWKWRCQEILFSQLLLLRFFSSFFPLSSFLLCSFFASTSAAAPQNQHEKKPSFDFPLVKDFPPPHLLHFKPQTKDKKNLREETAAAGERERVLGERGEVSSSSPPNPPPTACRFLFNHHHLPSAQNHFV
jgi:hypothetical protein